MELEPLEIDSGGAGVTEEEETDGACGSDSYRGVRSEDGADTSLPCSIWLRTRGENICGPRRDDFLLSDLRVQATHSMHAERHTDRTIRSAEKVYAPARTTPYDRNAKRMIEMRSCSAMKSSRASQYL